MITLAAQPVDAPPDIPDSEQTGDESLIQNTSREAVEDEELQPVATSGDGSTGLVTKDTLTSSVKQGDTVAIAPIDMNEASNTLQLKELISMLNQSERVVTKLWRTKRVS